jgi:GNAT superfamily N-acetyltransferase
MSTVRQIKADEWKLLRKVRLEALSDAPYAFSATLEEARQMPDEEWQRRAHSGAEGKDTFCVLGIDGDEPVGIAVGLRESRDSTLAYLVSMWVTPSLRGTGLAASLVNSVTAWARGIGARVLLAGVKHGNFRADAFYRKFGFQAYKDLIPDHPATSGCELVLGLRLRE